jgi:hypothetical protein
LAGLGTSPPAPFVRTQGCFAIRASSLAYFWREHKIDTACRTALRGMEGFGRFILGEVIPPSALMASSPSVPSIAVPEESRRWPTRAGPAPATQKKSIDRSPGVLIRGCSFKTPNNGHAGIGRNDIDVVGRDRRSLVTSRTGIRWLWPKAGRALSWSGSNAGPERSSFPCQSANAEAIE